MAAPTFAPALGLVDAAGVPISASNPLSVSLVAGGGGTAVSIADGADVALGSLADSSSALTVNGLLKAIKALLGAPLAVTGSFYQATQPVSIATPVAVTGTFWQATQPVSGSVSVSNFPATQPVSGTVSVSGLLVTQGSTTSGQSGPLLQGAVTTAAPTYVTGQTSPFSLTTGGALRVNSAQLPTTLGIAAKASSLSVALASDQVGTAGSGSTTVLTVQGAAGGTAVPVSGTFWQTTQPISGSVTATVSQSTAASLKAQVFGGASIGSAPSGNPVLIAGSDGSFVWNVLVDSFGSIRNNPASASSASQSNLAASSSSGQLLAANSSRRGVSLSNNSSAILYLLYAASTASATANNVIIPPNTSWYMPAPIYTGQINCIWASATGNASIAEL